MLAESKDLWEERLLQWTGTGISRFCFISQNYLVYKIMHINFGLVLWNVIGFWEICTALALKSKKENYSPIQILNFYEPNGHVSFEKLGLLSSEEIQQEKFWIGVSFKRYKLVDAFR